MKPDGTFVENTGSGWTSVAVSYAAAAITGAATFLGAGAFARKHRR